MLPKLGCRGCMAWAIGEGPGNVVLGPNLKLTKGEGPIISKPEIVRLYWGNWDRLEGEDSNILSMELYLQGLVNYMSGGYQLLVGIPLLQQHGVKGAALGAEYVDYTVPGGTLGALDLQQKIVALQNSNNLPPYSQDRIFVVFTNGITWDQSKPLGSPLNPVVMAEQGWCGYHGYFLGTPNGYVALVPYPTAQANCYATRAPYNDAMATWQTVASHEIFEVATDPEPFTGWAIIQPEQSFEGCDVCLDWLGTYLPMVGWVAGFVDGPETIKNNVYYFPCSIWQSQAQVVTPTINGTGTGTGTAGTTGSGTAILEEGYVVDLYCVTPGATIYYTLDGSTPPNNTSEVFTAEFLVDVTTLGGPVTITAVATLRGYLPSLPRALKLSPPTSIAG